MMYGKKMNYNTDKKLRLVVCTHCGSIFNSKEIICETCNSPLSQRKKYAFSKTLCFTLISIIFFIPANVLPMMHVSTLGIVDSSTIFDGILYFIDSKSYGIAAVIFIASIMIPIFKLVVLAYLLFVVYFKKVQFARTAIKYFRIIHFIGKWSMIDIFVVALMIVIVQFGHLTSITAGAAAPAFTIVVIMTIFATHSFDTRLLWDEEEI